MLLFASACAVKSGDPHTHESDSLQISEITEGVFVHTSYLQTNDFGKVACNGMVYFSKGEAIVFDTPVEDPASQELIDWIQKKQKKEIKAIVVTHFHEDCLGGIKPFHEEGILSIASNRTIDILKAEEEAELPEKGFDQTMELVIGDEKVHLTYFGEGHTRDNIVGYLPSVRALFGGCLIKMNHAGKGYMGDANTAQWPQTVQKIKTTYPDLKIVVPGHGPYGGPELLDYTILLFQGQD
jgi:metallo-beta-lactamase class B